MSYGRISAVCRHAGFATVVPTMTTSPAAIRDLAQDWRQEHKIDLRGCRPRLPAVEDLFLLGADALQGDPSRLPVRLRVARAMCGLPAADVLRGDRPQSVCRVIAAQWERGTRRPGERDLELWAHQCRVSLRWLRDGGSDDDVIPGWPEWLLPYHAAVADARAYALHGGDADSFAMACMRADPADTVADIATRWCVDSAHRGAPIDHNSARLALTALAAACAQVRRDAGILTRLAFGSV